MRLLFLIALICMAPVIQAQDSEQNLGSIINSMAEGIKPEAYKGKFTDDLENWKESSRGIGGLDVKNFKNQLGGLINGLKGKAFDGVSRGDLLKQLAGVNGKAGMKDLLNSVVSGLDPEMLTDDFKENKESLLDRLNQL